MHYKYLIYVLFVIFIFLLDINTVFTFNCFNKNKAWLVTAQESEVIPSNKKADDKNLNSEKSKEKDFNDEFGEEEEPNITTKIYRSVDPSIDLLEKYTKLQSVLEDDVLTKDELLGKPIMTKSKVIKRGVTKNSFEKERRKDDDNYLPWIIFCTLIFFLAVIFNIMTKVKV